MFYVAGEILQTDANIIRCDAPNAELNTPEVKAFPLFEGT